MVKYFYSELLWLILFWTIYVSSCLAFERVLDLMEANVCIAESSSPTNNHMVRLERTGDCDAKALAIEAREAVDAALNRETEAP